METQEKGLLNKCNISNLVNKTYKISKKKKKKKKIVKLQAFNLSFFLGQNCFGDDDFQNVCLSANTYYVRVKRR